MRSSHSRYRFLGAAILSAALAGTAAAREELTPAPATAPATRPAATEPADAAAAARPQRRPAPEGFLRGQRQQRDMSANLYNGLRDGGTYRLDTLLQFRTIKGALDVQTAALLPVGEQVRIKADGTKAIWLAFRQPQNVNIPFPRAAAAFNPVVTTTITRIDSDAHDDGEIWSTFVNVNPGNFFIMGQSVLGRIQFNQTNGQCNVNVMQWTSGLGGNIQSDIVLNAHASSIGQLRTDHPYEFRKHVLPLLAKLSDLKWMQPDSADVYTTFPQIPADDSVKSKIQALLPDLDSDAYPVRDAASTQLAALGPAGVLAALRMDWTDLSDEQRGRLLAVVNDHRRRDIIDPAAARRDLSFLADCLEYDDPAVRAAAKAAIEQALGRPVPFDTQASGDARAAAVDAVRKQIAENPTAPETQPTTQPVQ